MANSKRYEELNKQTLEQMYINKDMSAAEVAAKIGCSVAAVHSAARHFGLSKRTSQALKNQTKKQNSVSEELMKQFYLDQHMTLEEVHNELVKRNLSSNKDITNFKHNPFKYLDAKPSPEILSELYSDSNNTVELAEKLGVCHKTAINWLREAGIDITYKKRITKSQLAEAIKHNDSLSAVAKETGYSEDLVIQYATQYGYKIYARKK